MGKRCERDESGVEQDQGLQCLERGCFAGFENRFQWVGRYIEYLQTDALASFGVSFGLLTLDNFSQLSLLFPKIGSHIHPG